MGHTDHGRIGHALTGLQRKFAGEPAGSAVGADAAFGQRMLETQEPGTGSDRRSFGVSRDCGAGHDRVDENDLASERRIVAARGCVSFLANVVGVFTQDRRPGQVKVCGRIFEFDADLPARQVVGCFGGVLRDRSIFDRRALQQFLESDEFSTGPSFGTNANTFPARGKLVPVRWLIRACPLQRTRHGRTMSLRSHRSRA